MLDIPENIESVSMTIISFIRIISVLVDNAIEEAVHSEEKILQIAFFEMDSRQYFIVRNSSKGEAIDLQKFMRKTIQVKKVLEGTGYFR